MEQVIENKHLTKNQSNYKINSKKQKRESVQLGMCGNMHYKLIKTISSLILDIIEIEIKYIKIVAILKFSKSSSLQPRCI